MTDEQLPSLRYKELVRQIERELKSAYGWKAKAAEMLGVSPSYISKIARGESGEVGNRVVERAISSLRLPEGWFYDSHFDTSSFRHSILTEDVSVFANEALAQTRKDVARRARELFDQWSKDTTASVGPEVKLFATSILAHSRVHQLAHEVLVSSDATAGALATKLAMAVMMEPKRAVPE